MKKKLLSFLCICAACCVLSTTTLAADESDIPATGSCGENATWTFDADTKTLTVSGSGRITFQQFGPGIPGGNSVVEHIEFNGNITEIGSNCFKGFSNLANITIPDGITSIESNAFYGCSSLTQLVIPDSVTTIDGAAFFRCTSLSHVVIPASVTNFNDSRSSYEGGFGQPVFWDTPLLTTAGPIGSGCNIEYGWTEAIPANAFLGCHSLTNVALPEGVRSIGEAAFAYNNNLTNITLPSTLVAIDTEAFFGCRALEQLTIPASVIRINECVFKSCVQLSGLNVAPENNIYSSQDGALFNKEKTELIWCPESLISYTVPESVIKIGEYAFQNCTSLASITLPNGLEEIAGGAFENCTALTSIVIPDSVTRMSSFRGCTALADVTLSGGIKYYYGYEISSDTNLKTVRISMGTIQISGTFSGFTGLTTVYIPASVTEIGENTFKDCRNLTNIYYSGTQAQWDQINIADGNQEISLATVTCTGIAPPVLDVNIPTNPSQLKALADQLGLFRYVNFDILDDTPITKLELAELFAALPGVTIDASKVDISFSDCEALTDLQKSVIINLVEQGLFSGIGNNLFDPYQNLTRAQATACIYKVLNSPSAAGVSKFIDVDVSMWFYPHITSLCEIGIIRADSSYFNPNDFVTRLSAMEWLCAASLYITGEDMPSLPDIPTTPDTPAETPIDITPGGLGQRVTVQVGGGHWLTVQTRRAGAIAITSIQVSGSGTVSASFSAPTGSIVQIWETENEMTFTDGIPDNPILSTTVRTL